MTLVSSSTESTRNAEGRIIRLPRRLDTCDNTEKEDNLVDNGVKSYSGG
jgi:hypothetical protein